MIRVVAPFRPFPPESDLHRTFADFDWIGAIGMLKESVERTSKCPFHVITDVDTDLPLPTLQYQTSHRRLMLWYVEASVRYLESDDFDCDTIALDSDQLVYGNLARLITPNADLVVCIRPTRKHTGKDEGMPLLNGVQVWMHQHKDRLAEFYRRVLSVAEGLPEDRLVWGADTDALRMMVEPLATGVHERHGVKVYMRNAASVIEPFSEVFKKWITDGTPFHPSRPVVDFRWGRKPFMRPMFEHTFGKAVPA